MLLESVHNRKHRQTAYSVIKLAYSVLRNTVNFNTAVFLAIFANFEKLSTTSNDVPNTAVFV